MVVLALKSLFTLMAPHKRFVAWQECHKLVLLVYKATETFPRHELYGLTSQARRALAELEYALEVALALEYIKPDTYAAFDKQYRRARFSTWKLKNSMR